MAFHSNCGEIPYENLGLNSFRLRRKENCTDPCYNFNLVRHLEQLLLSRICLFDRELLIVIGIGNGYYWQWTLKKYGWCMVIKYYSQVPDWTLFLSSWSDTVPDSLMSNIGPSCWCQILGPPLLHSLDPQSVARDSILHRAVIAYFCCTDATPIDTS